MSPNPQNPTAFHLPGKPSLARARVGDDDGNDVDSPSLSHAISPSLSDQTRGGLLERARDWRLAMSRHSARRLMKY